MTDVPPPDSPKPPRGRPRRPKGFDDEAVLSEEEVARRVDVRGGGAPRGPVERAPVRDRRPVTRRPERTGARDSLLLIGLIIVGLVAVRLFLPDGPLTASATATPGGSQAAVATGTPLPSSAATSVPTGGVITLPPTEFVPTASPEPITAAPITAPPAPTPTLKPGQTPKPTPKPTPTPTPTPKPTRTPPPTVPPSGTPAPPGTATVVVVLHVVNNSGGGATSGDWRIQILGEVGLGVSNNNFPGEEAPGTTVTVTAGKGYQVNDNNAVAGYIADVTDPDCHPAAGLPANTQVTCTIIRNDKPRVHVITEVINNDLGTAGAGDWSVTVSGANASPSSFSGVGGSGKLVVVSAGQTYNVTMDGPSGYTQTGTTGDCNTSLGINDAETSCTMTFDDDPAPTVSATGMPLLPFLALLAPRRWLPHRWRSTRAG